MSRTMDLEGVKQAWQLRRQGKQQKDIAEALNLSLRHIQNYLSLDWLAQRSLKILMKGRTQELNEQLKMLLTLGEAKADGREREPKEKAKAAAGSGEAGEGEASSTCQAPEHWADVARLEDWGVPRCHAPGLLSAWRRAHHEEAHELCALWGDLAKNIQTKIPFVEAYDLAMASWLADRWGVKSLRTITELYRLYRPWEGKIHRKVYLDEVRSAIGDGPDESALTELGPVFEELPRRLLYGLPRRLVKSGHGSSHGKDD